MQKKITTGLVAFVTIFSMTLGFNLQSAKADTMMTTTTTTTTSGFVYTRDLTLGSTGADVVALQTMLVAGGYLVMPVGVPMGYFGVITQGAVAKYQAANGISPAVGYFGPITRAYVAAHSVVVGVYPPGCSSSAGFSTTTGAPCSTTVTFPAGCTSTVGYSPTTGVKCDSTTGGSSLPAGCSSTSGFSVTTGQRCDSGSTGGDVIGTPGKEATVILTKDSSNVNTNVYEGDSKAKVLGFKLEAKNGDALFQRVIVDLGTSTDIYVKDFNKIYVMDDSGNVLTSQDLNSSNVTRIEGSPTTYQITLAGFSKLVQQDTKRTFYIAVDVNSSISSEYRGNVTFTIPQLGVRTHDGADQDQYSSGTVSQTVLISQSLSDAATLTVSTDPNVLRSSTIVANQGSNNDQLDKAMVGSFTLYAEKSDVLVRDLTVTASSTSGSATSEPTAYLCTDSNCSSPIANASASTVGTSTTYSFTSIDQTIKNDGVNHVFYIGVDIRGASTIAQTYRITKVAVPAAESAVTGASVSVGTLNSGGNDQTIVSKGITVNNPAKTISLNYDYNSTTGSTTAGHLTAEFTIDLKAVGADAHFGTASTSFSFVLLKNGGTTNPTSSTVTVFYPATTPNGVDSSTYVGGPNGQFDIRRNSTGTVTITYKVDANSTAAVTADLTRGATFAVRLNSISYMSGGSPVVNDYSNNPAFVTDQVTGSNN